MIEKILKIDFQNFYISRNVWKSISWTFLGSLHNETIVIYAFHEIIWKKYFTVYPRLYKQYKAFLETFKPDLENNIFWS